MINLGLTRISRLLRNTQITWKAIHVAGTNGKGSVCAHISAMLQAANVPFGRFTSPHLIDRWDCIMINGKPIEKESFLKAESDVKQHDEAENIGASEFEVLTATAFTLMTQEHVKFGVIEVGMGGTEDATNILKDPAVTVITKIGRDHQAFLGNTIDQIASHKAGILKPTVPSVIDSTNSAPVIAKIQERASACGAGPLTYVPDPSGAADSTIWEVLQKDAYEAHQQVHISLAFEALSIALNLTHNQEDILRLLPAVTDAVWPGRLQTTSISPLTGRKRAILLDGAHNIQAAEVLASYVQRKLRQGNSSVTWVIALSRGKDVQDLLACLVEPQDSLIACEFGAVAGMPWVMPLEAEVIASAARRLGFKRIMVPLEVGVLNALELATKEAQEEPLVVAGSLYLVSDVLRAIRASTAHSDIKNDRQMSVRDYDKWSHR